MEVEVEVEVEVEMEMEMEKKRCSGCARSAQECSKGSTSVCEKGGER